MCVCFCVCVCACMHGSTMSLSLLCCHCFSLLTYNHCCLSRISGLVVCCFFICCARYYLCVNLLTMIAFYTEHHYNTTSLQFTSNDLCFFVDLRQNFFNPKWGPPFLTSTEPWPIIWSIIFYTLFHNALNVDNSISTPSCRHSHDVTNLSQILMWNFFCGLLDFYCSWGTGQS